MEASALGRGSPLGCSCGRGLLAQAGWCMSSLGPGVLTSPGTERSTEALGAAQPQPGGKGRPGAPCFSTSVLGHAVLPRTDADGNKARKDRKGGKSLGLVQQGDTHHTRSMVTLGPAGVAPSRDQGGGIAGLEQRSVNRPKTQEHLRQRPHSIAGTGVSSRAP